MPSVFRSGPTLSSTAIAIVCTVIGCSSDKPAPDTPTDASSDVADSAMSVPCRPFDGAWFGHAVAGIDDKGRAAITLSGSDGAWTCPHTLEGGPYEHLQLVLSYRFLRDFVVILRRVGGELVSISVGQNGNATAPVRVGSPVPVAGIVTSLPIREQRSSDVVAHLYAARASSGQVVSTTFDGVTWSTPTDVAGVITSRPFAASPFAWVDGERRVHFRDRLSGAEQVLGTASSGVAWIEDVAVGGSPFDRIVWADANGRVTAREPGKEVCTEPWCVCSEPWCITNDVIAKDSSAIWLFEGLVRSFGIRGFRPEPLTLEKALFATPRADGQAVHVRASDCAVRVVLGSAPQTVPNVGCAKPPSML